ncbi:MAG: hypothetical protein U0168_03500 [Nannocystaceae bacterium]
MLASGYRGVITAAPRETLPSTRHAKPFARAWAPSSRSAVVPRRPLLTPTTWAWPDTPGDSRSGGGSISTTPPMASGPQRIPPGPLITVIRSAAKGSISGG